tara:strand:+ start:4256 stop:4636 length:381 start_codon:yes stop_codon:yes gene_type:complete
MDKIIVGSLIKMMNKAKVYGVIDTKDLSIINIIYDLFNNSGLELTDVAQSCLLKIVRDISNKHDEICAYRSTDTTITISDNVFLTNTANINELYALWLNQGNTGTISEFLDLLLKDEDLFLKENNW